MDLDKVDLNAPAFGSKAQMVEAPSVEEQKPAEETNIEQGSGEDTSVEENKVPYSRFRNVSLARREAEKEAAEWRARVEELERERPTRRESTSTGTPDWWKKLYGDNDQTKEAYEIWQQNQPQFDPNQVRQEAIKAWREEQEREEQSTQENLQTLDEHLEEISSLAGHDLTENEESAVLDIIDEYTPKDRNGRYAGSLIEPDKAWEIYQLKNNSASASRRQSRDQVAGLTSSKSNGETSLDAAERDKNFVPQAWGQWRNRFKN